jgi:hypothetical protein
MNRSFQTTYRKGKQLRRNQYFTPDQRITSKRVIEDAFAWRRDRGSEA